VDIEELAVKVIEKIPEIIEKKPELAYRMYEILKKHFVPLELFEEYLKKLDRIEKKVDKIEGDVGGLRKDVEVLKKDVGGLRKDVEVLKKDVTDLKVSVDRVMISLEEEAWEWVGWHLRQRGITMNVGRRFICGMEINIFGVNDKYVLIGDAKVRVGGKVVRSMFERAKRVLKCAPEYRGKKLIVVLYTMHYTQEAVDEARRLSVWLICSGREVTKFESLKPL